MMRKTFPIGKTFPICRGGAGAEPLPLLDPEEITSYVNGGLELANESQNRSF